jgi:hypothetical protein
VSSLLTLYPFFLPYLTQFLLLRPPLCFYSVLSSITMCHIFLLCTYSYYHMLSRLTVSPLALLTRCNVSLLRPYSYSKHSLFFIQYLLFIPPPRPHSCSYYTLFLAFFSIYPLLFSYTLSYYPAISIITTDSIYYLVRSCCRTAVGVGQRALSLSVHMAGDPPPSWPRGG